MLNVNHTMNKKEFNSETLRLWVHRLHLFYCLKVSKQAHPGNTAAVSDKPVMLKFVLWVFWSLELQTHYYFLPPGILTVLVPLALCLVMVPVITAE